MDDPRLDRFCRTFPRGSVLFHEGDPGREMFVIQGGRVTISKRVAQVEKVLSTLGQGEFFGEMAILSKRPRSATATVSEDARILVIDSKTFEAMIRSNGEIALRMIKKLAERLEDADDQISNLLLRDASARVVHYLATAADRLARPPAPARVPLRLEELPARVGVEPKQVDEVVAKLRKAHLVEIEPDAILVPDAAKLRHFLQFLQMKAEFGDAA